MEYELAFEYNDRMVSCSIVYTMIQDGDETVPEITGVYFDEWVQENPVMRQDAVDFFYEDYGKGLVKR